MREQCTLDNGEPHIYKILGFVYAPEEYQYTIAILLSEDGRILERPVSKIKVITAISLLPPIPARQNNIVKCDVCGDEDADFRLMLIKLHNPERMQCVTCSAKQDGLVYNSYTAPSSAVEENK